MSHNLNGGVGIPGSPEPREVSPAGSTGYRSGEISPAAGRPKILLADSDPFVRAVLPKGLREEFEVVLARDGLDALTLFVRERPDVLVLGASLAEVNPFEICRALRTLNLPQPIFLLSTLLDPGERARGLSLGVTDFIGQPLQVREVLERLRAAVRRVRPTASTNASVEDVGTLIRAARSRVLPLDAFRDRLAEACENVVRFGASLGVVKIRWDGAAEPDRSEWLRGELDRNTRAEDLVTLVHESEAVVVLPAEGRAGTIGFLRRLRRRWESMCTDLRPETMPRSIRVGLGVVLPARDLRPPTPAFALAVAEACHDLFEDPLYASDRTAIEPLDLPLADGTYGT